MKVVQINAVYGYSSTGRTTKELHQYLLNAKESSWVFCTNNNSESLNVHNIGNKVDWLSHALQSRLFGLQGYFSKAATRRLLSQLDSIEPDIVHLRNLHANYINLPLLLEYLANRDIATVITLHDCWFFTGHCCYYTADSCQKWIDGCHSCSILNKYNKSLFFDNSSKIYSDKKRLFSAIPRLAVVGNSDWTTDQAKDSLLRNAPIIRRIYNWVDLDIFYPHSREEQRSRLGISESESMVLGVAQGWSDSKGLNIFIDLANRCSNTKFVLVGDVSKESLRPLPSNIICAGTTNSTTELAEYYSAADIFINPSTQETFGKVSAEALACGTPLIVNNATANPELVADGCGYVVESNNIEDYIAKVNLIMEHGKEYYSSKCKAKAKADFNKEKNIKQQIDLYNDLLTIKR